MSEDNANRVANFLKSKRQEEAGATTQDDMQKAIADGIAAAMPEIIKAVAPQQNNDKTFTDAMTTLTANQQALVEQVSAMQAASQEPAKPAVPAIDLGALMNGVSDANRAALEKTPGFAETLATIAMNAAASQIPEKDDGSDITALKARLDKAEAAASLASITAQSPRLAKYMEDPKFLESLAQENPAFGIPNQALYNAALKTGNTKTLDTLFDQFEAGAETGDPMPGFAAPNTGGHASGGTAVKTNFTVEDIELASQQAVDGKISLEDLDSMVSAFETQNAA